MSQIADFLIPILIFSSISIMIVLLTIVNYRRVKKLTKIFQNQAHNRNGIIKTGFFIYFPSLEFEYHHNKVKVYAIPGGKNSSSSTRIIVDFKYPTHQNMVIYRERFASNIKKKFGMQDIALNVDYFDEEVIVKGSDELYIKKILTFGLQEKILGIINKYNAYICLENYSLEIYVPKVLYDESAYDELISTTLTLIKKVKGIDDI